MKQTEYIQFLAQYEKGFKAGEFDAEQKERRELCEAIQKFTKDRLLKATDDDIITLLNPLWALSMWGNKQKHIQKIIDENGLDYLRKKIANLLYGSDNLDKRWDDFRRNIKGMGPAIMSELLCKAFPDEYILWNIKAVNAYKALEIKVPNYQGLDGASYLKVSEDGKRLITMAKDSGYIGVNDFLSLDYFFWKKLQDSKTQIADTFTPVYSTTTKQKDFIHNDVRDKIMEIGGLLGFDSSVEVPIATGAKVDAIWQASIGNMGRVIYVFEVQTSGSIDSLVLNLMKAKTNKAVQGIVAVTDEEQIDKIKKEITSLPQIKDDIKFWNYEDVIKTYEALTGAMEIINSLGLVPDGMIK